MDKFEYDVIFDGRSGKAAGLIFQSPLELSAPEPNVTTEVIPGRNGDLHIYDGSYKNRTAYLRGCLYDPDGIKGKFSDLNAWLFKSYGYCTLETNDDPDVYMMARVVNGSDVASRANKMAPISIKFDCKPQRYLKSGIDSITVTQSGTVVIDNPTVFSAKPLLRITFSVSSGTGTIIWDDGTGGAAQGIHVSTLKAANYGGKIFYDAELDHAYYGGKYFDSIISYERPIVLNPGRNEIAVTGDISSVEIIPRWWIL